MPTVYSPPIPTYVALATVTLASPDTSITFSSIPSTYRDLVLISDVSFSGEDAIVYRFNGDAGSNYYYIVSGGNGSSDLSDISTRTRITNVYSGSTSMLDRIQIIDYSATDKHKTVIGRNDTPGFTVMGLHRWDSTNAISQIEAFALNTSFQMGDTISLYGIEA